LGLKVFVFFKTSSPPFCSRAKKRGALKFSPLFKIVESSLRGAPLRSTFLGAQRSLGGRPFFLGGHSCVTILRTGGLLYGKGVSYAFPANNFFFGRDEIDTPHFCGGRRPFCFVVPPRSLNHRGGGKRRRTVL